MTENTAPDGSDDPFSTENIGIVHFIMLSRIYDVLMADLNLKNPETANQILDLHSKGEFLGAVPTMSGVFLTDSPDMD